MLLREINNREEWDELVIRHGGHPLQLWGWGEVKCGEGNWQAYRLWVDGCGGAQVLIRKLPKPFNKIAYIPRGPVFIQKNFTQKFLSKLVDWAKQQGCIEIKIEPNEFLLKNFYEKVTQKFLSKSLEKSSYSKIFDRDNRWKCSKNHVLLNKTVILDLKLNTNRLLHDMSKKTRQYINKSSRENIKIRRISKEMDIKKCLKIYRLTAQRANFDLHKDDYYLRIAKTMGEHNQIYVAERGKEILSFLWNVTTPEISFELYGGVTDAGQRLRANYILKWQVIQECKNIHVKYYDMNGLLNDGVSSFKLGFSGDHETYLIPTLDKPLSLLYVIWEGLLPTGKKIIRKIRKH